MTQHTRLTLTAYKAWCWLSVWVVAIIAFTLAADAHAWAGLAICFVFFAVSGTNCLINTIAAIAEKHDIEE